MSSGSTAGYSEMERELELYFGRELEMKKSPSIRVTNTVGATVEVTFEVDAETREGQIETSGYYDQQAKKNVDAQILKLTGVTRARALVSAVAPELPTEKVVPKTIRADLQFSVQGGALVMQILTARAPVIGDVMGRIEEKDRTRRYVFKNAGDEAVLVKWFQDNVPETPSKERERSRETLADGRGLDFEDSGENARERSGPDNLDEKFEAQLRASLTELDAESRQLLVKALRADIARLGAVPSTSAISALILSADNRLRKLDTWEESGGDAATSAKAILNALDMLKRTKPLFVTGAMMEIGFLLLDVPGGKVDLALKLSALGCELLLKLVRAKHALGGIKNAKKLLESLQKIKQVDDIKRTVLLARENLKQVDSEALRDLAGEKEFEADEDLDELELDAEDDAEAFEEDEELDEGDGELDDEIDDDLSGDAGSERELDEEEDSAVEQRFARELQEVLEGEFESAADLDEGLDRGLDAMAHEYFVKRLHRRRRRGKGRHTFGKILKVGAKLVGKLAGNTPIGSLVKAGTSLVQGDAKGVLKNLAKAAAGTVLGPVAGTVATTALDALGGEEGELRARRRRAVRRVARISRDTFREMADTLPEEFDHPLVANQVVHRAVRRAMLRNRVAPPGRRANRPGTRPLRRRPPTRAEPMRRRVVRVRPDEEVLLIGEE